MKPIALVGIGKIALDQHIPAISDSPDWSLAAVVSRNARLDGVENFVSIADMLAARPDIETVCIAVPPRPRFEIARTALAAGRHVMLEKPPGATLGETRELERMANQRGLSLFATWHSRQAHEVETARAWLADKRIKSVAVTWKEDVRKWHPGQDWVFESGGLGVFDPGINALSILTRILPDHIHVTDAELVFPANRETPIAARLEFWHPHGAQVRAVFDWAHQDADIWRIDVGTDAGTARLENGGAQFFVDDRPQSAPASGLAGEYPRLYARMNELVGKNRSDVDLAPSILVADAFVIGRRVHGDAFHW